MAIKKGCKQIKMARKDKKDYSTIELKKSNIKKLKELKIHPQQPYHEVIEKLLGEKK